MAAAKKQKRARATSRNVPSVQEFLDQFATEWNRRAAAVIACGRIYLEAKEALPHGAFGQFTEMLQEKLLVNVRIAQMLMCIAKNSVLTNTKFVSFLPGSYTTLYEMTKLPDAVLEQMLRDGTIRSETGRERVKELVEQQDAETTETTYWHRELSDAFKAIASAMQRNVPTDEIIDAVIVGRWARGFNLMKRLPSMAEWLTKIGERCAVKLKDKKYMEAQAGNRWFQAILDREKQKKQNKFISPKERARREQARHLMQVRNESHLHPVPVAARAAELFAEEDARKRRK